MFIWINLSRIRNIIILLILLSIFALSINILKSKTIVTSTYISNPNEKELEEVAQIIFDNRNKASLGKIKSLDNLYNKESVKGSWAYEQEVKKAEYLQLWAEKQSINLEGINSKVFLRRVNQIENGYQLNLAVTTEYIYTYKGEKKDKNSFRIGTYHSLDIINEGRDWRISGEWYEDPFINSLDEFRIDIDNIKKIILSKDKKDLSDINNNRKKAVEYADKYCGVARPPDYSFHYNDNYKNYNSLGGNCTNFVSQVIHNGGMETSLSWNYNKGEASKAWVNASEFNNYMLYSGRGTLIANGTYEEVLESTYKLLPGDYIAFEKNGRVGHNAIVIGVDSKGYPLINTHNPDYYRVPWDLGWNNKGIRFWLVSVNY